MQSIRFSGLAALCAILFATQLLAQDLTPGAVVGPFDRLGNIISIRTATAVLRLEFCTSAMAAATRRSDRGVTARVEVSK